MALLNRLCFINSDYSMKVHLALYLLLLSVSLRVYPQETSTAISFKERSFNFGKIYEAKGRVSHTFTFSNKGRSPIIIERIAAGCGCTTYSYTKEPVAPGKEGNVAVSFDPQYRQGFFSKEVTIFCSDRSVSRVWVKGSVVPEEHPVEEDYPYAWGAGLYTNLKVLAFGEVGKGRSRQVLLRYANDSKQPMALRFSVEGNRNGLRIPAMGLLPPKGRGEVLVNFVRGSRQRGVVVLKVYPVVNGKKLTKFIEANASCI